MIYPIVKYPEPILTTPAGPVDNFGTEELKTLVADMFETMYKANGVGLAAPQINLPLRLTVIDCSVGDNPEEKVVLINPEIIHREGKQVGEEGCLSIPGFRADVARAMHVRVKAQDVDGNWFEMDGAELLARAMQHEIDHLNGVLFINHISPLKRDLIKRKIRKMQKEGDW